VGRKLTAGGNYPSSEESPLKAHAGKYLRIAGWLYNFKGVLLARSWFPSEKVSQSMPLLSGDILLNPVVDSLSL
jgi:hypothetical protein